MDGLFQAIFLLLVSAIVYASGHAYLAGYFGYFGVSLSELGLDLQSISSYKVSCRCPLRRGTAHTICGKVIFLFPRSPR